MTRLLSFLVLAALALQGCVTNYQQYTVGSDDYVLATHEGPNGSKESYKLVVSSARGDASLHLENEYDRDRPFLGFQVAELDKRAADKRGVRPYTGLLILGTYPTSSAKLAGVMGGDILLSIDGKEMVYLPQLADFESTLKKDQAVQVKVLRGQDQMDLTLSTQMLRERVTDPQDVPLESAPARKPYAGVTLRGIPAVWAAKVYGTQRNAVVVTNVVVGSPAWIAGIRGGDVIDTVDGAPVPSVQDLSSAIAVAGEQKQVMRWGVSRGTSEHYAAELHLCDYDGETNVWVPLVFWLENGAYQDRWSAGPFGLLMSNRNHYVADSTTRIAKTTNVFDALLGLIHVKTGPDSTEVRLLWLIRFDT